MDVKRVRRTGRNAVVWLAFTGGIVAFVLGQSIIGAVVLAFAIWQFIAINAGRSTLFVDQRAADREGKPNLRSR